MYEPVSVVARHTSPRALISYQNLRIRIKYLDIENQPLENRLFLTEVLMPPIITLLQNTLSGITPITLLLVVSFLF